MRRSISTRTYCTRKSRACQRFRKVLICLRKNLTNSNLRSLLERLSELPIYGRKDATQQHSQQIADNNFYDPNFITKLTQNYRSHPEILEVPNRLFYHGDLVPSAKRDITDNLLNFPHSPAIK